MREQEAEAGNPPSTSEIEKAARERRLFLLAGAGVFAPVISARWLLTMTTSRKAGTGNLEILMRSRYAARRPLLTVEGTRFASARAPHQ